MRNCTAARWGRSVRSAANSRPAFSRATATNTTTVSSATPTSAHWVNLAAGTQVSDLHNISQVGVTIAGRKVLTGLSKVGAFLGDHTKTGLNTLLNTGTVAGAFCNLLPIRVAVTKTIPSFCQYDQQFQEALGLAQLFATAAAAMHARGCELTSTRHTDFLFGLYEQTAEQRRQVFRQSERRPHHHV